MLIVVLFHCDTPPDDCAGLVFPSSLEPRVNNATVTTTNATANVTADATANVTADATADATANVTADANANVTATANVNANANLTASESTFNFYPPLFLFYSSLGLQE
jgi:hypothetical protein